MPIYEYKAVSHGCKYCRRRFEVRQKMTEPPLEKCPQCGAPVVKQISAPAVGRSQSGFDDRAKAAGFHKLKRTGKGEYEKKY